MGRKFLNIVKECFKTDIPLKKIFNKNTLKRDYSCMPNLERKINTHNKSLLQKHTSTPEKPWKCQSQPNCPLNERCLVTTNIIYQVTVECENNKETYIGFTSNQFKSHHRNHTVSFRDTRKRSATKLNKHIWTLKDSDKDFMLSWKVIAHVNLYSNTSKQVLVVLTLSKGILKNLTRNASFHLSP